MDARPLRGERRVPRRFFNSLLHDYTEEKVAEEDTANTDGTAAPDAPDAIPIPWLASFVYATCSPFSFDLGAQSADDVVVALGRKIGEEIQAVQAYARALRATGVMPAGPPENVQESTRQHVQETVHPWPRILEQPTPELADGRFAKAFPLKFPMGVADPRQPRLRSDYSFIDAVQHLFRYSTGHFLNSNDGHRVVWALDVYKRAL